MQKFVDPVVQTISNNFINFLCLENNHYSIFDIAHGLSNIGRYVGHTSSFYSVAQHSCLGTSLVSLSRQLAFLMHDSQEAYMGDIITPFKHATPALRAAIKEIEDPLQAHIFQRFGIDLEPYWEIKAADYAMLDSEMLSLLPEHNPHDDHVAFIVRPVANVIARRIFLEKFFSLGGKFVQDDWNAYCKYAPVEAKQIEGFMERVA